MTPSGSNARKHFIVNRPPLVEFEGAAPSVQFKVEQMICPTLGDTSPPPT